MVRRKFSREFKIEAVKLVMERGVPVSQACRDLDLAESVLRRWMREAMVAPTTMGPHPDVPDVLRRLRKHYKLAIFTNSDDDLIAPTVARIGVPFDYVITAEQARAFKPSRDLFEYAYRKMGVTPDETVHVAMGMYWDMKARHELGLRGIWVDRRGETGNPEWMPYAEVADLNGASALLLPGQG